MCIFNSIANVLKIKNSGYLNCYWGVFDLGLDLGLSPYSNFSLLHNSIRHRRIFDIIKSLRRFIIELQMKSLCMHFGDWVLKLLNCIAWRLNDVLDFSVGKRAAFFILSIGPWLTITCFFEKTFSGPLVVLI